MRPILEVIQDADTNEWHVMDVSTFTIIKTFETKTSAMIYLNIQMYKAFQSYYDKRGGL